MKYDNNFKKTCCEEYFTQNWTRKEFLTKYNIPLKTFEKWISKYNKNPKCFDNDFTKLSINASFGNYDNLSFDELKLELLKKDIELARLKKNYSVVYTMGKKEYITYSKKNTM